MNNLKALMEKRNAKVDELKAILNVALEETRAFTEEEKEQRSALENEIAELNDTIEILKNNRYNDSKKVEEDEEDIKMAEIRSERELQNVQLVNYLAGKDMMNGITVEERAVVGMGKEAGAGASSWNPIKTNDDESAVIIPEVLETNFVEYLEEESNIVALVEKIPSVKGTYHILLEDAEVVNQMAEGVLEGETPTKYGQIKFKTKALVTKRFVAQYKVTQQMIMNSSIDIVAYVLRQMAKQHARRVEHDIFVGNGKNESGSNNVALHGINNETAIEEVVSTVKDAISMDDLNKLSNALLPQFVDRAKFFVTPDAYRKIALLKDGEGHYFLQNGVVNGRLTKTLLGFEIVRCPYMTADAPVYFGDLGSAYAMMIRKGMELQHVSGDTQNAQARTHLLIMDVFMDGCVKNAQAIVRLKNHA